jgi:uncharacterized protein YcgL (UPF0745 family)
MECFIYRSRKKLGAYLYLPEEDNFSQLPESLLKVFGIPEYSFKMELTADKKLAQADAAEVIAGLEKDGYFMQLSPIDDIKVSDLKMD